MKFMVTIVETKRIDKTHLKEAVAQEGLNVRYIGEEWCYLYREIKTRIPFIFRRNIIGYVVLEPNEEEYFIRIFRGFQNETEPVRRIAERLESNGYKPMTLYIDS